MPRSAAQRHPARRPAPSFLPLAPPCPTIQPRLPTHSLLAQVTHHQLKNLVLILHGHNVVALKVNLQGCRVAGASTGWGSTW